MSTSTRTLSDSGNAEQHKTNTMALSTQVTSSIIPCPTNPNEDRLRVGSIASWRLMPGNEAPVGNKRKHIVSHRRINSMDKWGALVVILSRKSVVGEYGASDFCTIAWITSFDNCSLGDYLANCDVGTTKEMRDSIAIEHGSFPSDLDCLTLMSGQLYKQMYVTTYETFDAPVSLLRPGHDGAGNAVYLRLREWSYRNLTSLLGVTPTRYEAQLLLPPSSITERQVQADLSPLPPSRAIERLKQDAKCMVLKYNTVPGRNSKHTPRSKVQIRSFSETLTCKKEVVSFTPVSDAPPSRTPLMPTTRILNAQNTSNAKCTNSGSSQKSKNTTNTPKGRGTFPEEPSPRIPSSSMTRIPNSPATSSSKSTNSESSLNSKATRYTICSYGMLSNEPSTPTPFSSLTRTPAIPDPSSSNKRDGNSKNAMNTLGNHGRLREKPSTVTPLMPPTRIPDTTAASSHNNQVGRNSSITTNNFNNYGTLLPAPATYQFRRPSTLGLLHRILGLGLIILVILFIAIILVSYLKRNTRTPDTFISIYFP